MREDRNLEWRREKEEGRNSSNTNTDLVVSLACGLDIVNPPPLLRIHTIAFGWPDSTPRNAKMGVCVCVCVCVFGRRVPASWTD